MAEWHQAAKGRLHFLEMIDGLTEGELDQQSLCDQWTARGVLCHITSFVETSAGGFIKMLFTSGFDFEKGSMAMADTQLARPLEEVKASLRSNASKSAPLPGFAEAMTTTDLTIHTQDVRRPLGLPGALDEAALHSALQFLTTHKAATQLVNRKPIDGVSLRSTDLDWTFGSGPEISGPAEALMMAMADRQSALSDLSGEGLNAWT